MAPVALATADLLDRGKWRLMTDVNVDRDGEPLPDSLWYRVEVEVSTGWVELVEARASPLGVSEESARDEAKWTALQNGLGVPDDLSGLGSPSRDRESEGGPGRLAASRRVLPLRTSCH